MNKKNQKMLIVLCVILAVVCAVYIGVAKISESKAAKAESEAAAKAEAERVFVTDMSLSLIHI